MDRKSATTDPAAEGCQLRRLPGRPPLFEASENYQTHQPCQRGIAPAIPNPGAPIADQA